MTKKDCGKCGKKSYVGILGVCTYCCGKSGVRHTPTPWEVFDTRKTHPKGGIFISSGALILAEIPNWKGGESEANAAFIVRACNAHDELVEALRRLLADGQNIDPIKYQPTQEDIKFAQAALKKATGE